MRNQNGDRLKWRHQNGDNPKRRKDKGNITETATEKCGHNGDKGHQNAETKLTL